MEYLDPWTSRAFAVADHQVAHVYVRDPADVPARRRPAPGGPGRRAGARRGRASGRPGLDHERSGELVLVAGRGAWFTYYYWLDDSRAPDFARTVEIHRKPGYDPAELFLDPADPFVKARAGLALASKKAGLRYTLDVVPLDASWVKGTHGRLPDDRDDGPVLLCSEPLGRTHVEATEVRDLLLEIAGLRPHPRRPASR